MSPAIYVVLGQATDEPTEGGGLFVWLVIAVVLVGLYLMTRRSQKRASESFSNRHKTEEELRTTDPDLQQDD